jgi:hypothetical protein
MAAKAHFDLRAALGRSADAISLSGEIRCRLARKLNPLCFLDPQPLISAATEIDFAPE